MKHAATETGYEVFASGGVQFAARRMQRYRAQETQKTQKCLSGAVFQLARSACSQHLAQDQAQIKRAHVDQLALENVFVPALTPLCTASIRFLFVRPSFCLQLSPDSISRWTPLPFG